MTAARRALIELIEAHHEPLTVTEMLEYLHGQNLRVNKTTVYREIAFLREQEYVQELDLGEGGKRYERAQGHHHHVVCVRCHAIEHVDVEDDIRALERKLERRLGGSIQRHLIEFFRLCPQCSQS